MSSTPKPLTKSNPTSKKIVKKLSGMYPDAHCALTYETPLQLLLATILSAQCTDERVNQVTPHLFKAYPDVYTLARAKVADIEVIVKSTGFFRNKAKSIKGASEKIVADFGGEVPRTLEALITLPGVGRKTANVVLGNAYGINVGVVVDTHVSRLSQRLGLTVHKDPVKIEQDLMTMVPRKNWTLWSHWMIWHGRKVCKAIRPRCSECQLANLCPSRVK